MEISSNDIIQTECNAKAWMPPTRLQAQAPAPLDLEQMTFSAPATANNPPAIDTSKAIPFLSPLVLSPQALQDSSEKLMCGHDQSHEQQQEDKVADKIFNGGSPENWWLHPEAATCMDPPLCSLFRSQCMIVNPAQ